MDKTELVDVLPIKEKETSNVKCLVCGSQLLYHDNWRHCGLCNSKATYKTYYAKANLKFNFNGFTDKVKKEAGRRCYFTILLPPEYAKYLRCNSPKGLISLVPEQDITSLPENTSQCYYCKLYYVGDDPIYHYDKCEMIPILTLNEIEKLRIELSTGRNRNKSRYRSGEKEINLWGKREKFKKEIEPPISNYGSYYICPICGNASSFDHIDKCLSLSEISINLISLLKEKEIDPETRKMLLENFAITIESNTFMIVEILLNGNVTKTLDNIKEGKKESDVYDKNDPVILEIIEYLLENLNDKLIFKDLEILCKYLSKNEILQKFFRNNVEKYLTIDNCFHIYNCFILNHYDPDWMKIIIKENITNIKSMVLLSSKLDNENIKDPTFSLIISIWTQNLNNEKPKLKDYEKDYDYNDNYDPYDDQNYD